MELFARTLQTLEPKTREQVVELKATLWALVRTLPPGLPYSRCFLSLCTTSLHTSEPLPPLSPSQHSFKSVSHGHILFFQGHVGSTNWGINFLVEEAIIPEIVRLAEECGNFAIRGYDVEILFTLEQRFLD